MTTNKHQLSSDSEKIRSISFNPFRNKIQPTDTDSDRSASEQSKMIRETGTEKDRKKRGKHTFTAMVSMLKNSIKPVGRLLAKRFRSDTPNELCCICFDSAQVKHWGVFLCDLCEEFLVENVFSQHTVLNTCPENGYCILRTFKLEICSACKRKRFIEIGLQPRFKQQNTDIPSVNLLDRDSSYLTKMEFLSLSNSFHSLDKDCPKALAYQFINDNPSESCPKICFNVPSYYNDLIESMYRVTHAFIYNNQDVHALPEFERQLVHRHGYNNIAMFCGPVVARNLHLFENRAFIHSIDLTFGITNRKCSEYIASKLDLDPYFIMFVMAIYVFSSSSCTSFCQRELVACDDVNISLALFRIQNVYTEVTWKYLTYRYSFEDAVKRFDNLIQCFIVAQNSLTVMENDRQHDAIRESLIAQIKILFDSE